MTVPNRLRIIPSLARVGSVRESILNDLDHKRETVVIDFSSPNIAKPFHFGHLKSTILGNFLANIYSFYGHHVTRLNYIGDWGTQYGLLSLGLDNIDENLLIEERLDNQSLLERLVTIYVAANERGKADENFYRLARQRFELMDSAEDADQLARWRRIREISLKELKQSYNKIGISFDAFEFESDHAKSAHELVKQMISKGFVQKIDKSSGDSELNPGELLVAEVVKNNKIVQVPVLKSDGTSLYMTRDIAAAVSRQSKYKFDKLIYVVGADQERHFHCLREIVKRVTEANWANNLLHVKIGKVVGMSSRSGNFVLLSKIIEESKERYIQSTMNTPTSKVSREKDIQDVGEQLAISALFVYDMRNKRTRNYEFDWDQVMQPSNRSGLQLQGSYARLCSLREKSMQRNGYDVYESLDEIDYSERSLRTNMTSDANDLVGCLNKFSESLRLAYSTMDPHPLVNYAFELCRVTNRARRNEFLQVITEADERSSRSRLTLFDCAREQLESIIKMIGLTPLTKI